MPLPPLDYEYDNTLRGLHLAAEVLGALRLLAHEHDPHWLELALLPVRVGLASGRLPHGGEVVLDMTQAAVVYHHPDGRQQLFALAGMSQAALLHGLLAALAESEFPDLLKGDTHAERLSAMRAEIARKGHTLLLEDTPQMEETFVLNSATARDYAHAHHALFSAVARVRARLKGHMTPIVVFPEHFDLSTLWFRDAEMDEYKAHINIGFAPFSPGLPRPYLYAYAYPYPPDVLYPSLPAPARWHFTGWTGVVLDYDDIAAHEDAVGLVERLLEDIVDALRGIIA
jgi:hypothetical protein